MNNKLLFSIFSIGFFLLLGIAKGQSQENLTLTVMSFNIRLHIASDGENNWENRRDWVGQMIEYNAPDIIGCQEVLFDQLTDMLNRLPAYGYVGVGRDDGIKSGEFSPIFYKRDKFQLIDNATFWLSETPQIPGKGWDAAYVRIVSWAELKDKASGKIFYAFNTHFDNMGEVARKESALLLLRKIYEIAGKADAVITGDFNSTKQSEVYALLTTGADKFNPLLDTYYVAESKYGPEWTFHGFGQTPVEKREKIDYIFINHKNNAVVSKAVIISEQRGNLFLSDHCPVLAEIIFR